MCMKKIKCFFNHQYSKWVYIRTNIEATGCPDVLKKTCERCGKEKFYEGFTNTDIITWEKTPRKN